MLYLISIEIEEKIMSDNQSIIQGNNSINIKSINDICSKPKKFFIPYYQRGYRWTKQEIYDLLNDINDFINTKENNSSWYCIQPLVLKYNNSNSHYEVIDGQQRLTTIYLILHYLHLHSEFNKTQTTFSLSYDKSRQNLENFLKSPNDFSNDTIDSYYMSTAYKHISEWFEKETDRNFKVDEFLSHMKNYTRFIWYETTEDPIPIFLRLNIGKIRLTNSELIKALFLNSSYYKTQFDDEDIYQKQLEKAIEWDNIENHLQDDTLWLFLSNDTDRKLNRIELIFNLIANENNVNTTNNNHDTYATFRFFYNNLKSIDNTKRYDKVEEYWNQVKDYYGRFIDWSKDCELYNKIGYILNEGISDIKELCKEATKLKKSEFKHRLDKKISDHFRLNNKKKDDTKKVKLEELEYSSSSDKKIIKSALLLYNILTMLKSSSNLSSKENMVRNLFFPFDLYKKEKWDIEHIASQTENDNMPDTKLRIQWLDDLKPFIETSDKEGKKILEEIDLAQLNKTDNIDNDENFYALYVKINGYFHKETSPNEPDHNISNLTLLDSHTNRSYGNAVFPVKRKMIIERDREGKFVPICTKNAFLKYFNDYPTKLYFWTEEDKDKYMKDIKLVLKDYVEVN